MTKNIWQQDLWDSFGPQGIVCLAYFLGSAFAKEIRSEQMSFPFLRITGEPGTGKTTLTQFLWKFYKRDNYEGFDPKRATFSAQARVFDQAENEPVVLIDEFPNEASPYFDWDNIKVAYDGRSIRVSSNHSGVIENTEFKGSIVIVAKSSEDSSRHMQLRTVEIELEPVIWDENKHHSAARLRDYSSDHLPNITGKKARQHYTIYLESYKRVRVSILGENPTRKDVNLCQLVTLLSVTGEVFGIERQKINKAIEIIL